MFQQALTKPLLEPTHDLFSFNTESFLMCAYLIAKVISDERWAHPTTLAGSWFMLAPKQGKAVGSWSNKRLWHWWACFPNTYRTLSLAGGAGAPLLIAASDRSRDATESLNFQSVPLSSSQFLSAHLCQPLGVAVGRRVWNFCVCQRRPANSLHTVKANIATHFKKSLSLFFHWLDISIKGTKATFF